MKKTTKIFLNNLAAGSAMVICSLTIVVGCLNTPIVEMSHSTGECVKVVSNNTSDSCENLPKRYDQVWVQ